MIYAKNNNLIATGQKKPYEIIGNLSLQEESILGETNSLRLRRKLSNISEDILDKASNLAFEFNKGSAIVKQQTIDTLKKDFIQQVRRKRSEDIELENLSPKMTKRRSSEATGQMDIKVKESFHIEEFKKSNTLEPKEF